jgi:predicted amidohydrolase YtcJ
MIQKVQRVILISASVFLSGLNLQAQLSIPQELVVYPDLIVHNAKIVTMNDYSLNASPGRIAEAMAVRGDLIQFVGSNLEVLRYAGPQTRKIDLNGRTVVPGLIDTHNHLHNSAANEYFRKHPERIEPFFKQFITSGKTFEEVTKSIQLVVKEHMANRRPGQWAAISLPAGRGVGIGPKYLREGGITEAQLDAIAPDLPTALLSGGGGFLVNAAARNELRAMFMGDPANVDAFLNNWEARGPGTAFAFIRSIALTKYFGERAGGLAELADVLQEYLGAEPIAGGFTTYSSHLQGLEFLPAFQKLVRENRMPIRLGFAFMGCAEFYGDMAGCFKRHGDWTGMGGKYFWNVGSTLSAIDGGPPGMCTTLKERSGYQGLVIDGCLAKPGTLYHDAIYTMLRSRMRYVVNHAMGDKSMDIVLDLMEKVVEDDPDITLEDMRRLRVTSDHCFLSPRPDQIQRLAKFGMIISCPAGPNLPRILPWIPVYGEQITDWNQPAKGLLEGGVMVTSEGEEGGDATPFYANYQRMTRKTETGKIVGPNQAIDRVSAIKMQTIWAAHYVLKEKELGSLEPGKLADFLVLNKDYFAVPEADIPTVFPLMTILGGKTAMLRAELASDLSVSPIGLQKEWKYRPDVDPAWEAALPRAVE